MTTLTLGDLAARARTSCPEAWADLPITGATLNSSAAQPGDVFFGVPGASAHGARFAADSAASAVITDADGAAILAETCPDRPHLIVDDVRSHMGPLSAAIYGDPSAHMRIIGITGTSGKTTTSYLVEQALMAHHRVGIIGTTGTRINGRAVPTALTTPEAPTMQALLADMRAEGVTHVVMEVSSHAIALGRIAAVRFDVVAFTNLSQDHLDFHPTMEDYFSTKASLFDATPEWSRAAAVICADDAWGQQLLDAVTAADTAGERSIIGIHTLRDRGADSHAAAAGAGTLPASASPAHREWSVREVSIDEAGRQHIRVTDSAAAVGESPAVGKNPAAAAGEMHIPLGLVGDFNVANATVALGCCVAVGEDPAACAERLAGVQVPGRMEAIDAGQPFLALVDYAHKPGALEAILATLRGHLGGRGRIGIVLGAGGDRDREKRPLMGAVAARDAELIIVTDDNPRSEDPAAIRAALIDGARALAEEHGRDLRDIPDRAAAIAAAVRWAEPGDAIVVAGKGHETGQIMGDTTLDFDDRVALRRAIDEHTTAATATGAQPRPHSPHHTAGTAGEEGH